MEKMILDAKIELYRLLLKKTDLTDNETDIMYLLSKDEQIQSLFK